MLPAHAGMIPLTIDADLDARRAPRTCGDDPVWVGHVDGEFACSPHMRG